MPDPDRAADGANVRIGYDRSGGGGYVTSYGPGWAGVATGAAVPIRYKVGGATVKSLGTGVALHGMPGVFVLVSDAAALPQIVAQESLTLTAPDIQGAGMTMDMAGGSKALTAAQACESEQD